MVNHVVEILIVVQTVFDFVVSCVVSTRFSCCEVLVLTQGVLCEALVLL